MNLYEEKFKTYMRDHSIQAEHLVFEASTHSVEEAARAAQVTPEDFVKNICMIDTQANLIVAIVKGEDRASTSRIGQILNIERPRIANAEEILEKTGYPVGGTPSFGYPARFLIDPKVMEMKTVYTGGGSENSLIRISTRELVRANGGQIVRIRR